MIFKKIFLKQLFLRNLFNFFYKNNWFFKSIFNFYNFNINNSYKKNNHPLLNFFSFYNSNFDNKFKNVFFLKKIFKFLKKKNIFKLNFNFFDFLILHYFIFKKYFNILSSFFYNSIEINQLKLNYLFVYFNKNLNLKKKFFNLNYYNDWYNYLYFNKKLIKLSKNTNNIFKKDTFKFKSKN